MRRIATALMLLLPVTSAAHASGGIGCQGKSGAVTFEINSGVTRGMGSPVFQFSATVETTDTAIEPDLRKVEMTKEHLAQYWLDGEELKMVLYRERAEGDHGYVSLTVQTSMKDEGVYEGRFDVEYFETKNIAAGEGKTVKADGDVSCFVE